MANFTFRGLMAPVFTPFKDDYSLNLEVIPGYVQHLKKQNINGILVNGTTGEGMSLSVQERIALTECWTTEAHKMGMHVMVQVGGAPMPDVLTLTKHAESVKVDSILTLPELFFKPKSVSELVEYLKIVGKAAPKTPLLYYHIPSFSNVVLNMAAMVTEAKKTVKTFRGLKFTAIDLVEGGAIYKACGKECTILLGADQLLAPAVTLGFDSAIGTTFNMFPSMSLGIMGAMNGSLGIKAGINLASTLQDQLTTAIDTMLQYGGWVPTMKAAMELVTGLNVGPPRAPIRPLSEQEKTKLAEQFREQGIRIHKDLTR